jgi:hypothetical protein
VALDGDLVPRAPLGLHTKRLGDLGQGGLLRFAHLDAADAENSALLGGLGDALRRPKEPPLEALGLARRVPTEQGRDLTARTEA